MTIEDMKGLRFLRVFFPSYFIKRNTAQFLSRVTETFPVISCVRRRGQVQFEKFCSNFLVMSLLAGVHDEMPNNVLPARGAGGVVRGAGLEGWRAELLASAAHV